MAAFHPGGNLGGGTGSMPKVAPPGSIGVPSVVDNMLAYMALLQHTSLLGWIFLALLGFVIINFFCMGVVWNFFPNLLADPTSLGAFGNVNLLIGFLYFLWIGSAMNGHTATIQLYRQTVTASEAIGCIASSVRGGETLRVVTGEFPHFMYSVFTAAYFPTMQKTTSDDPELQRFLVLAPTTIARVKEAYYVMARRIANLPPEVSAVVDTHIKHIANVVSELDASGNIRPPTLLETHLFIFLFFYFAIFVPVSLFVQFGWIINIVVYPFLMLLLVAPKLYIAFLGDPFDPRTPQPVAEHHTWHTTAKQVIDAHFAGRAGS